MKAKAPVSGLNNVANVAFFDKIDPDEAHNKSLFAQLFSPITAIDKIVEALL